MKTRVIELGPEFTVEDIAPAAEALQAGGLVGFPTETVYGIAASAKHPEAVHRLHELQERPDDEPFSLHIASVDQLHTVVESVPPIAESLIELYWPGPLTIIFPGNAGSGLGVRIPAHPVAELLIRMTGSPLIAPSANRVGRDPAIDGKGVLEQFEGEIDVLLDAGPVALREPSTVVRLRDDGFQVLREGIISKEMIDRALSGKKVIFVCTGNSCRSPMARVLFEKLLAERLGCEPRELPDHGYRVSSAGVSAFGGGPASRHAIDLMAERGLDLTSHRTRTLTREMAEEADLIIALSHTHEWQIIQWNPALAEKVERLSEQGIEDPIGGDLETYRRCAEQIEDALRSLWVEKVQDL